MRPAIKRVGDLQRALDAARSALIEARVVESAGTRETAGALADAEQVGRCLAAELATESQVEGALQARIGELESSLRVLRAAHVDARLKRELLAATADAAGTHIVALRGKLESERASVAPLLARRAKEVERLERRIAMVQAHQAARAVVAPAKPRVVLGFPQALALLVFLVAAAGCEQSFWPSAIECRSACAPRLMRSLIRGACVCDDTQPDGGR